MITIPPDLNFLHPSAFFLVFGAIVIASLYFSLFLYRRQVLKSLNLATDNPRSTLLHRLKIILLCLAWIFAVFALMGPQGNAYYPETSPIKVGSREVVLLIDVSDSMSVVDTRIGQSRLDHAKEIADDLAEQLAGRDLSLTTFTSELAPQVPQTMDVLFTRLMINRLKINEGGIPGTDFLQSLTQLKESIGNKSLAVVLLSDGGDTKWEALSAAQKQKRLETIADVFKETKVKFVTVGIGSHEPTVIPGIKYEGQPVTTKLNADLLKAIGSYFEANQITTIGLSKDIVTLLDRDATEMTKGFGTGIRYEQYFQIPLFLALLFLFGALFCPETRNKKGKP